MAAESIGMGFRVMVNILLQSDTDKNHYYVCLLSRQEDGLYVVSGKYINRDGQTTTGSRFTFNNKSDAVKKCRSLAKNKTKRRGYVKIPSSEFPSDVATDEISPKELINLLENAKKENYVIFHNISGISDYFDVGIEYLGYLADDNMVSVYDRFGGMRDVLADRLSSITPTERNTEMREIANKG